MFIPKIFYQSWDTEIPRVVLLKNKKYIPSDFIYKRFSLTDIRLYLIKNWPIVVNLYDAYVKVQHKIDLWRYCILYDTGGIYMDADCILMNSIEPLLLCDYFFVSNNRGKTDIFNGFLGTYPHNPIYYEIIEFLLKTGPIVTYYFNCIKLYEIVNNLCLLTIDVFEYDVNNKKMFILWDKLHPDYRCYPYFKDTAILVETNPYYPYKTKLIVNHNMSVIQNGELEIVQNASG